VGTLHIDLALSLVATGTDGVQPVQTAPDNSKASLVVKLWPSFQ